MNEDAARNRMDTGPQNLAVLRHMALNVMHKEENKNVPARKIKKSRQRLTLLFMGPCTS